MVKTKTFAVLLLALMVALSVGCSKKQTVKTDMEQPAMDTGVTEEVPVVEEAPAVEETKPEPVMPKCEDVFFDFDKYNLKPEAKTTLEMDAKELNKNMEIGIVIEGHCDERGTEDYNMALGEKRAKAVKDYLVSLGVAGNRMTIISYGESRPFDPGHTESAWAKNRRAHFVLKK